ncbi:lectin [Polyangium sp. 15x6]|uniref:lectin n=1 Tax=Polyangium sp. 15x6 TaxID=3042687 RepID=UPI00249AADAA|nr:lectin [Polyangium sp. 15x6]MDI3290680.1 lectin [Polyangium sp. 15x6]
MNTASHNVLWRQAPEHGSQKSGEQPMNRGSLSVVGIVVLMSIASIAEARDRLQPNEHLARGESLTSSNGIHSFVCQDDGNLVLYIRGGSQARWASGTHGRAITGCYMQGDGNLVLYAHSGQAVWATGTHGHPGAYLIVQDDGNVVIYSLEGRALWSTNTWL